VTRRQSATAAALADPAVVTKAYDLLAVVARAGFRVQYGTLAKALGSPWTSRNLGPLLDAVAARCAERGEPSLDSLVLNARTGRPGAGWSGRDPEGEQRRCHHHHVAIPPTTEENP